MSIFVFGIKIQCNPFEFEYLVLLTHCWRYNPFIFVWFWHSCQRWFAHMWQNLFLGFITVPLVCVPVFILGYIALFIIIWWYVFRSRRVRSLFILHFQDCFGYLGSIAFLYEFRISLSVYRRIIWDFDNDCSESVD